MPARVLERANFSIIPLEERTSFKGKQDEVQKRLREFTDSGHTLDPTVQPIFAASAHNEELQEEENLVCTAPSLFDCPEGISMGALFQKEKTVRIEYEKNDHDAIGKVELVPKRGKLEVSKDYQTLWTKQGFDRCRLADILDFLPKVESLECEEVIVAHVALMRATGRSLLRFKREANGKFCLYRMRYDPEYFIGPMEQLLFKVSR